MTFPQPRPFFLKSMTFPGLENAFSNSVTFHDRMNPVYLPIVIINLHVSSSQLKLRLFCPFGFCMFSVSLYSEMSLVWLRKSIFVTSDANQECRDCAAPLSLEGWGYMIT